MAVKPHILSFDEARRDTRAPASSARAPLDRSAGFSADTPPSFESPFRQAAQGRAPRQGAARPRTRLASAQYSRSAAGVQARLVSKERPQGKHAARRPPVAEAPLGHAAPSGRRADSRRKAASARPPRGSMQRPDSLDLDRPGDKAARDEDEPQSLSRWASFKKNRAKSRAERKFSKQFGEARSSADSEGGPRAALYKAEMGTKQRQAARMQDSAASQAAGKKSRSRGALASRKSSRRLLACAAVSACLVASCLFLYPAARQYYHAVRDQDRLNAEYQAIEARNGSLEGEVSSLNTAAGVEDRAHKQFGWVKEGDQAVNVSGLDIDDDEGSSFSANIAPGSVKAPETWYSPLLDALFGVQ